VSGVTYDAGALIGAERNDRSVWALHAGFLASEVVPTVPAPVLAQVWRGGARQANLVRFLALCEVEDRTREHAESVGVLAARAGHGDIVDVTVVEGAVRRGDAVVTSDRAHLDAIAASAGTRLRIAVV
jgi:hypothetical protein